MEVANEAIIQLQQKIISLQAQQVATPLGAPAAAVAVSSGAMVSSC
jgi:hypothetical protein